MNKTAILIHGFWYVTDTSGPESLINGLNTYLDPAL